MKKFTIEATEFMARPLKNGHIAIEVSGCEDFPAPPAPSDYTVSTAAKRLGVSPRSIYNYITRTVNPLPARKVGGRLRFTEAGIEQWVARDNQPKTKGTNGHII